MKTKKKITILTTFIAPVLTKKKCHYCGFKLFFQDNQHWCSNPKCPKGLPFGLWKK